MLGINLCFLFFWGNSLGAEKKVVYSPASAMQQDSAPVTSHADIQKKGIIGNPKLMDDADLNFDEVAIEDFEEQAAEDDNSPATANATTPQPAADLPILQKNVNDVLPSNRPADDFSPSLIPAQPLDDVTALNNAKNKSLTDTFMEKKVDDDKALAASQKVAETPPTPDDKTSETWLNKIKVPLGGSTGKDSNLENMVESAKQNRGRSNASVFDISGLMLRMSLPQVEEVMKKRGFQKVSSKLDIPNFIRWRNEDTCRNSGVVGYERLANCVIEMARKDKHEYVLLTKYSKFSTKEEISVNFTSNFTNNKAYKIIYRNIPSNIMGANPKANYLRNIKVYDFWKRINQKYGTPDNKEDVTWGLGGNKPYLKASTGFLSLEDPMLRELDYTRMSREDKRFMNTGMYSF